MRDYVRGLRPEHFTAHNSRSFRRMKHSLDLLGTSTDGSRAHDVTFEGVAIGRP